MGDILGSSDGLVEESRESMKWWKEYLLKSKKDLQKKADFMESQLVKMAGALACEGRETLDDLGDGEFYLWFVERWGDDDDKANAEIEEEEE